MSQDAENGTVTIGAFRQFTNELTAAFGAQLDGLRNDMTEAVSAAANPSYQPTNPALQMPTSSPTPVASNPIVALREGGGLATPSRGGG